MDQVPNWPQFSSKVLWQKAKSNPNLAIYFPDYTASRLPQRYYSFVCYQYSMNRKYMLNIANTISPNSVV